MAPGERHKSPCLLVVEDDPGSCVALAKLLGGLGYTVATAATVRQAREAVDRNGCDLLIADIGLPDGTGVELLTQLRETCGVTKAIAMTGYTAEEEVGACAAAGFSAYLAKPVKFEDLEATVRKVLGDGAAG